MAAGVNVKMGVSGVAQFKQNINAAKQSIKTMDQALSLNEKQFRATGDAEDYMQQKGELLQAKMREQRAVIEQTERALKQMADGGVDKGSKAFQEMQRQLLQAKGDLLDTESALNGIDQAGEDAGNSVSGMNTQLKNIGKNVSLETIKSGIDGITGKMEAAARWAWKLGEALVKNVLGAGSYADELKTTADQYGETILAFGGGDSAVETLQRMRYTAREIDTDVETIIGAHDKMKRAMGKEKDQETMGAFAALGIDPNDHENVEDAFWKAGEALKNWGDEVEREEYAQKIFGKSWKELLPLFNAGRDAYEKTMASWSVLSEEQVNSLGEMDDSYQRMSAEWETFQETILSALSGPMKEILDTLTGLMKSFNDYLATPEGKEMLEAMGRAVSGLFDDLTKIDPQAVVQNLQSVFTSITDGLKWLDENRGKVIEAMRAIVAGWAALKLTGGALSILQLITGIKGLGAASAEAAGAAAGTSWGTAFAAAVAKAAPWLAGLFALLNPASTGNDDLWDKNGNPTELAKAQGITETQTEFEAKAARGEIPRLQPPKSQTKEVPTFHIGGTPINTDPVVEAAKELYMEPTHGGGGHHFGGNEPTHDDFQEFSSLPAQILAAVKDGVANITVVVDGPTMAGTVGGAMANTMLMMTK